MRSVILICPSFILISRPLSILFALRIVICFYMYFFLSDLFVRLPWDLRCIYLFLLLARRSPLFYFVVFSSLAFHFQAANFHIFRKLMLFSSYDRKSMIEMDGRFCWWRRFTHCMCVPVYRVHDYKITTNQNTKQWRGKIVTRQQVLFSSLVISNWSVRFNWSRMSAYNKSVCTCAFACIYALSWGRRVYAVCTLLST